jgi:hypothetical protein
MKKANARNLLDNEAFMMDLFIAIVNVMDLDPDIKNGWIKGLQNRKMANKEFVNAPTDPQFDKLVEDELALLGKLKEQIPAELKTAYATCWRENITWDETILTNL